MNDGEETTWLRCSLCGSWYHCAWFAVARCEI
jgi:hypothetical protein